MKALVLSSGGVDSTTCLALAVKEYGKNEVMSLAVFYGQKHEKELKASRDISEYYNVEHIELDLSQIFKGSDCSLLTGSKDNIPHDSYANLTKETKGKPVSTYVPFRNGLFLSTAASIALSYGAEKIYYGAHSDDAAGSAYPDCSEEFVRAMDRAVFEGSGKILHICAPFVSKNKAFIVKTGLKLKVPYEKTWSCYEGNERPCGTCATCIDRKKAFEENNTVDPLSYL